MLKLGPELMAMSVERLLCLGAHPDDIEIGCGGTILRLLDANPDLHVDWIVFSASPERSAEAKESAERVLRRARSSEIIVKDFRESYFPYLGAELKEYFDQLGRDLSPDLVFTHSGADFHQDHRLLSELSWNTFRNHLILEYEIPKYDGDLGRPNIFVQLTEAHCDRKLDHLMQAFPSQHDKHWFSRDTFLATLRLRGVEAGYARGHAEGFYCRKLVLG